MRSLRKDSITEQVYALIQRQIESGRIKPGQRIYEHTLAEQLAISKTPLRLALHQLKRDGIVKIIPRQGIYLVAPTPSEVFELIEMREVLEGLAARRAATCPERGFIAQMKNCLAGFSDNNVNALRSRYAKADHRFHMLLTRAAGSGELMRSLEIINLRLHMNRLRNLYSRGHDLRPIHHEHVEIVSALERRAPAEAEQLVRKHVRNVSWQTVVNESAATETSPSGRARQVA